MTPIRMNSGATREMSNDRNCTIRVVPTLAPSIAASPGTRSTSPPAAKPVTISPVAVLLCNTAVIPSPARNALPRLPSAVPRIRRRLGPNARWIPLWTICTPHSSSATDPARSIRVRVAFTAPPCEVFARAQCRGGSINADPGGAATLKGTAGKPAAGQARGRPPPQRKPISLWVCRLSCHRGWAWQKAIASSVLRARSGPSIGCSEKRRKGEVGEIERVEPRLRHHDLQLVALVERRAGRRLWG